MKFKMTTKHTFVYLIPVIFYVNAKVEKTLPSSPVVFYGGFKPMLNSESMISETKAIYASERSSNNHLSTSQKRNPKNFQTQEKRKKKTLKIPFHKDSVPTFPLFIPDKDKFTIKDAIVGKTFLTPTISDNSLNDNLPSDQFLSPNIFSFLQNMRLPTIPLFENMIKRPPSPPPPVQSFVTVPHISSPNNNHIPNLESVHNDQSDQHEALNLFNEGLDNFIQNPSSLSQIPRPTNGNNNGNNSPLILPPGMTIEQKTQFLANLDKKNQWFIAMPHMNAGKLTKSKKYLSIYVLGVLPLHHNGALDLYPPLKKKKLIYL